MKYLIAAYVIIFAVLIAYYVDIDIKTRAALREIFSLKNTSGNKS